MLLGPVLRHVSTTTATVWSEAFLRPAQVEVLGCRASTFTVREQHYALVEISGLAPGSVTTYQVHLDPAVGVAAAGLAVAGQPDPDQGKWGSGAGGFLFLPAGQAR